MMHITKLRKLLLSISSVNFSSSTTQSLQHHCYDLSTCITSLQACAQTNDLNKGKQFHKYLLINDFFASPLSITSLINMYSKCDRIHDALSVFNSAVQYRNVYTWNAVIAGFIANGDMEKGVLFYRRMRCDDVEPDKFTFPCVIKACFDGFEIRKIHGVVFKYGLEEDVYVGSALANSYLKFRLVEDAQQVFEELPVRDDVVLWNAMINGCVQIGQLDRAFMVFKRMCGEGFVPNNFTATGVLSGLATQGDISNGSLIHGFVMKHGYESVVPVSNALIDMYGKCKRIGDALRIFEMMNEKDIFSWNSIITVLEKSGDHQQTLKFFGKMLAARVKPDLVTFTTVLPACANLAAAIRGRQIHGYMIIDGFWTNCNSENSDNVYVNNAIIEMYVKCGTMREAKLFFDNIRDKDVASWNIMIKGYGMHGYGDEALDMFFRMCEARLKPDNVTFVGILSACNHAGFVSKGREFFTLMKEKYDVIPTIEHYTCLIDMLGRAGELDEAYDLAVTIPIEANSVLWRAFLHACTLHKNMDLAEIALEKVIELDPEHCGSYVLMSNIYGASGRYEELREMRYTMKQQDVKKTPGCSWIELKNGVHTFLSGDKTHSEAYDIYAGLNSLTACLHEHGYAPSIQRTNTENQRKYFWVSRKSSCVPFAATGQMIDISMP